jgi:signal transduction histidine kinase
MTQRTWWWRIGGPNAVTVWSWWATLPLALLASAYGGALAGLPLAPWIVAAFAVNLFLIVPLVIVRATYLSSRPRPSRPALAVLTFASLGALRSLLMVGVAAAMGYADVATILWEWPLMGAIAGAFSLSIVAVVVDSVREHRAATQRLLALQASLRQINEMESARLVELEADFVRDVEQRVLMALEQVRVSTPPSGPEAGRSLREVSEAVVRPLSHQLAAAEPWTAPEQPAPRERWTRKVDDLVRLVEPVHPLGPVLVFELTVLPFMLARFGLALTALNLVVGPAILLGLGLLIRRVWPTLKKPWLNILGLAAAYAASFAVAAAAVSIMFDVMGASPLPFWSAVVAYPMLVLAWSLLDAVLARRVELEEELAESLAQEAQAAERLRTRIVAMQRRVAKILHSVVQGELVTSAVSLARTDDPGAVCAEIDRVSASIVERLRAEDSAVDSRERILDLLSLWSAALTVDLDAEDEVWAMLDIDAALREAVVDVLAEGLTNAVRHGSGPSVSVSLRSGAAGIAVDVQSQGHLRSQGSSGLGMQTIASSAQSWSLEERAGVVHLSVTLAS